MNAALYVYCIMNTFVIVVALALTFYFA